jgi:hypothetical protein
MRIVKGFNTCLQQAGVKTGIQSEVRYLPSAAADCVGNIPDTT